jgi:hypothetical protein
VNLFLLGWASADSTVAQSKLLFPHARMQLLFIPGHRACEILWSLLCAIGAINHKQHFVQHRMMHTSTTAVSKHELHVLLCHRYARCYVEEHAASI